MSLNEKCYDDMNIFERFIYSISPPSLVGIVLFKLIMLGIVCFILSTITNFILYIVGR